MIRNCGLASNALIRGTLAKNTNLRVKLNEEQEKLFGEIQERAVTTGASPGSTYIDDQLIASVYSLIAEYGIWRDFDVIPVSTKSNKLLTDDTDPVMGFVGEGVQPSEASYTGSSLTAEIKKMLAWIAVSTEMLEDSEIDLSGLDSAEVRGTLPHCAWTTSAWWLMAPMTQRTELIPVSLKGATAFVAAAGKNTVAELDSDDYLKAMLSVDAAVLTRPGARWTMHPFQLVRSLMVKDLNGRPIFLSSMDAPSLGAFGSINGYPVRLAHVGSFR